MAPAGFFSLLLAIGAASSCGTAKIRAYHPEPPKNVELQAFQPSDISSWVESLLSPGEGKDDVERARLHQTALRIESILDNAPCFQGELRERAEALKLEAIVYAAEYPEHVGSDAKRVREALAYLLEPLARSVERP